MAVSPHQPCFGDSRACDLGAMGRTTTRSAAVGGDWASASAQANATAPATRAGVVRCDKRPTRVKHPTAELLGSYFGIVMDSMVVPSERCATQPMLSALTDRIE